MRVLLTGHLGYIGSVMTPMLLKAGLVEGDTNAGVLAAQILALSDPGLAEKLEG